MKTYKMYCENINLKKKKIISQHDHFSFSSQNHSWKSHCPMGYFISNSEIKKHWSLKQIPQRSPQNFIQEASVASKRLIIISCSTTFNPITPTTLRVMFALCVDTGIKNVALCSPGQAQKLFSCRALFGVGAQKELYSLCNVAAGCR